MYCDDSYLSRFFLPLRIASLSISTQADETKFTFSRIWTLVFTISGAVFYMASLFLPWGIIASSSTYVYLPGSIMTGEGTPFSIEGFLIIMQARAQLLTVSNLIKAAIIVGWAGVVLYWYIARCVSPHVPKRVLSYSVIFASSVLSFMAVAVLALTEITLSWGAYLALVGGILVVFGILMKELKVEVIVEREMSDQEE